MMMESEKSKQCWSMKRSAGIFPTRSRREGLCHDSSFKVVNSSLSCWSKVGTRKMIFFF